MISKTFKSATTLAIAVGFAVATLAACGAKKEEAVEETPVEEVAPPVIEEVPADTTMIDTTAVDTVAA
jgi:hypothetical protein